MEGARIAYCPGDKWEQRKQPGREGETESGAESQRLATVDDEGRPEDYCQQGAIGTQKGGKAPGKDERCGPLQAGALQHLCEGTEAQRHAEDGKGFGEWGGYVSCGEGAESGEQQGDAGGAGPTDLTCQD